MELLLIILIISLPLISQLYITVTYKKTSNIEFRSDTTGYDVARNILDKNGLNNILVVETNGTLTDHYDPTRKTVRLSTEVFHGDSVASLAIAAHECGHAIQDKDGYFFMRLRSFIYPVVNLGTTFAYVLLIIGAILEMHNLIMLAIALYGLGLVFQLITLPVEIDASKRALNNLNELGLTDNTDASGASRMLRAAAYTYVAGVLSSALEIIRLLAIFGRDRD